MDSFKALFFSLQKFLSACGWFMLVRMSTTLSSFHRTELTLTCSFYVTFFQFSFFTCEWGGLSMSWVTLPHMCLFCWSLGHQVVWVRKKLCIKFFYMGHPVVMNVYKCTERSHLSKQVFLCWKVLLQHVLANVWAIIVWQGTKGKLRKMPCIIL